MEHGTTISSGYEGVVGECGLTIVGCADAFSIGCTLELGTQERPQGCAWALGRTRRPAGLPEHWGGRNDHCSARPTACAECLGCPSDPMGCLGAGAAGATPSAAPTSWAARAKPWTALVRWGGRDDPMGCADGFADGLGCRSDPLGCLGARAAGTAPSPSTPACCAPAFPADDHKLPSSIAQ